MRLLSRCVLLLALLLALAVPSPAALPAPPRPFAVVGYLPEWRYSGASFDSLFEHLSHLIFFSVEPAGDGSITGLDRLPSAEVLAAAQEARRTHGTRLLLCLGGNGRSNGFSYASRDPAARARLAASIADAVVRHGLDGWDANWEYPGFSFSGGYKVDEEVEKDWDGLATLLRESRTALQAAFAAAGRVDEPIITLAYYPDGRQERELAKRGLVAAVDLMHAMSYDAPGEDHSPLSLAEQVVANAREAGLPLSSITLGLPFYGRNSVSGEWTTYEDLLGRHPRMVATRDRLKASTPPGSHLSFNGAGTIARKTALAVDEGMGGVMVWESGQDCRQRAVHRDGVTHVRTCPDREGEEASLHAAITRALAAAGRSRAWHAGLQPTRPPDMLPTPPARASDDEL